MVYDFVREYVAKDMVCYVAKVLYEKQLWLDYYMSFFYFGIVVLNRDSLLRRLNLFIWFMWPGQFTDDTGDV